MADYIEPTKTDFENAEQVAIDVLTQADSSLLTKTGSVIRELVIRPAAYLLSWITGNIQNDLKQYSVSYLKTSQLTENPVADAVASNYFVTRRQGTPSKGIITLTLTDPTLRISIGAPFTVAGVPMCTPVQYLVLSSIADRQDTDTLVYLRAIPYDDAWIVNVPVVAVNAGRVELPVGSDVSVDFSCATLVDAELTSPVTGGTDTETDAELMKRAEYNTAEAGIGTYYGILKKMTKAPVAVAGLSVIAGEDKPLFRARYNSVNINPGGFVDCHVKTCNQAIIGYVDMTVTPTLADGVYTCSCPITADICTGFIKVSSVIANGVLVEQFAVSYSSDDDNTNADGARLSVAQEATVTFTAANASDVSTRIYLLYMPSIKELQQFIDKDTEHFIGQDTKIKAAVPVTVRFSCDVKSNNELTEDDLTNIKQTIVDYINNTNVGVGILNFSDIRAAVLTAFPQVDLRVPCVLSGEVVTKEGYLETFYSTAGILDITKSANSGYWGYQVCFFSACVENMRLNVL